MSNHARLLGSAILIVAVVGLLVTTSGCVTPTPLPISSPTPSINTTSTTTHPSSTSVTILIPQNNSAANRSVIVRGTVQALPQDHSMWLVVVPKANSLYYPQTGPVNIETDGRWSSTAWLGSSLADLDKKFDIVVVTADKNADRAFSDYMSSSQANLSWPGMNSLPAGAVIQNTVTVTLR